MPLIPRASGFFGDPIMKMSGFEKRFVNRERKAKGNIKKLVKQMQMLDLPDALSILEIGCGIGSVSAYLADNYSALVWGTDFDSDEIEMARKLHPENDHLRYQVEDASNLSFGNDQFDLVVSQNVFHHIPKWGKAIYEISRVLKSNGYLFWLDLAFPRPLVSVLKKVIKNYGLYTIKEIRTTFKNAGLEELNYEKMIHGPMIHHHLVLKKNT
jgi:ubiquinone/menaquinone biosynthesis C-methylase UbiE